MSQVTNHLANTRPRKRRRSARAADRRAAANPTGITKGAAAAERASAGMGTADLEPTDWLFGDTLSKASEVRP